MNVLFSGAFVVDFEKNIMDLLCSGSFVVDFEKT